MSYRAEWTTEKILTVFTDTITAHHGHVRDVVSNGRLLLARSVLPRIEEVRSGDGFQGGVAIRANDEHVWLYPYLFRLTCKNGSIYSQSLAAHYLDQLHLLPETQAAESLSEAIAACCEGHVFTETVQQMREASRRPVDRALDMLALMARFNNRHLQPFIVEILNRYFADEQTQYGLVNAITSVARDVADPQVRWDLEEFGGALVMRDAPEPTLSPAVQVT